MAKENKVLTAKKLEKWLFDSDDKKFFVTIQKNKKFIIQNSLINDAMVTRFNGLTAFEKERVQKKVSNSRVSYP